MGNLDIYEKVRTVPKEAQKDIQAGRLRGKTDINPMWRIKELTEQFGPCGIGWKYIITDKWLESSDTGEIAAFININLYFKHEGQWSEAIPGTGGSMFVANESKGPYVSDECFKMALTDAISVACKALGFGADIYWDKDPSKYNKTELVCCQNCGKEIKGVTIKGKPRTADDLIQNSLKDFNKPLCGTCLIEAYKYADNKVS